MRSDRRAVPFSPRRAPRVFPIVIVLTLAMPAVAAAVTVLESTRQVVVSSFVDVSGITSDAAGGGFESAAPGAFLEAVVDGTGLGDLSVATGEALQDSSLDTTPGGPLRISGGGSTGVVVDVQDPGQPSQARARSTSLLSVLFEVEEASPFALGLSMQAELAELSPFSATASVLTGVSATFSLIGADSGEVFAFETRDDTAFDASVLDDWAIDGVLAPDVYRLEILADTELQAFENAAGFATTAWGVDFHVVPEPSTALLVALGLAGLAARSRRDAART